MNENQLFTLIAEELHLRWNQIKNTVELLDSDNTVPFIARYRKEITGSLDEEQIRAVGDRMHYLRNLEDRKQTVLKSIEDQGKLTPDLKEKICAASILQEVEDLYLPYKPKRRTRATIAREKGLEPLADLIIKQDLTTGDRITVASDYLNEDKGVMTPEEALAGARDIVAEMISDNADIRKKIRESSFQIGLLLSEARNPEECGEYDVYKDFSQEVKTIPPHRILAINRGEREKYLRVWLDCPEAKMIVMIKDVYPILSSSIFSDDLKTAIVDSYKRLISPAIERDIRKALSEKADQHAIEVFARNLRALLLAPPMRDKAILGIDPGYRTGCKVAVIDATGKYLHGETIFPHPPQKRWQEAKNLIISLVREFEIDIIAIGNGTASRETEKLVAETLGELDRKIFYTIVNEAGASVYSASAVAKKEFPDLEASMRGNISIARRLLDPLSELVKIDPRSIGVGLYQHDINQVKLTDALDRVVESAVNLVGVNLNTASASLLKYVSGINAGVAENIIKHREKHGPFSSRDQLKEVKGLGENLFIQSAGFLRIPESDFFFDTTAVHPESYSAADKLLTYLKITTKQVKKDGRVVKQQINNISLSPDELTHMCQCGKETLEDIIESLEKPNRDPRDELPKPILRSDVLDLEDLEKGMVLKGTVRNVVDFGAFVDIGVKHDGLVHLSRMAKRYVKNPLDVVSVGDVVDVKVVSVDKERGRIGLSMVMD